MKEGYLRKPEWLKIRLGDSEQYGITKQIIERHRLHTICTSGRCPNQENAGVGEQPPL